jgi:hypothetical protein
MTTSDSILELAPPSVELDFAGAMRWVQENLRKPYGAQVIEILKLARGPGKLRPADYFEYRLFDDTRLSFADKQEFLSEKAARKIFNKVISPFYYAITHDKVAADVFLKGAGFAVPETLAIYHPRRSLAGTLCIHEASALADFIRCGLAYPCFVKPIRGWQSRGTAALAAYDSSTDQLIRIGAEPVSLEAFVAQLSAFAHGAIFQELLRPHAEIEKVCGERLSTVRPIVLAGKAGPEFFRGIWKIPTGDNIADNFWRAGNMLGAVEPEGGTITRVVRGTGLDQEELEAHPDSGGLLKGFALPLWEEVLEVSLALARLIPEFRIVSPDVAITDRGVVVVEINAGGAVQLPQHASGRGFNDAQFRRFVAEVGDYEIIDREL